MTSECSLASVRVLGVSGVSPKKRVFDPVEEVRMVAMGYEHCLIVTADSLPRPQLEGSWKEEASGWRTWPGPF